ncbi:MAG: hypothetical protein ACXVNF_01180 [Neobacillus sp.]
MKVYDPMGLNTVEIRPTRLELHELRGYNEFGKLVSVELSEIVDVEAGEI